MKKTVLFVILEHYADWEYAFLASALQDHIQDLSSPYEVRTVSLDRQPIRSIGGFTTIPDFGIDDPLPDHAGVILIGGTSWRNEDAKRIAPLVQKAYAQGTVLGAICDATAFLGMSGLLNERRHTSNTLDGLREAAGESYTGQDRYVHEQAVRDGHLITANGTAYLEFTREALTALDAYPAPYIANNYQYFKKGFIQFVRDMGA